MAFPSSSTLRNEPRRTRLLVNSPNQRSIRLSQLELVGTKWGTKRGWRSSQARTLGLLVRSIVIHDQVQGDGARKFLVETPQKAQELLMPMALKALPDDAPLQHFQGGEQGGGAVALIVMPHRTAASLLQGQARLSAVQGLNLALLITQITIACCGGFR